MPLNGYANLDDPYGRASVLGIFPGWCSSNGSHGAAHPIISRPIWVGGECYRWQCPCCGDVMEYVLKTLVLLEKRCCREQFEVASAAFGAVEVTFLLP